MEKAVIELQKQQKRKAEDVTEQEIRPSVAAAGGLSFADNAADRLKAKRQSIFAEASIDSSEKIEVQFNPSEIHINSGGRLSREKTGVDKNRRNVDYGSNTTRIIVSIPLIFEEEDNNNSQKHSKMKCVNMLLDAVRTPRFRKIIFRWGSQVYSGALQSAAAEYMMFNSQGIPIRAKVTIEISCKIDQDKVKAGSIYE